MQYLFDSHGRHIANEVNGHLHAPTGENIGHYMASSNIFIDMNGNYLGEVIMTNRLLYNLSSPYRSTNFGNYGSYGNVGNYGNPGNYGSVGIYGGFKNVEADWL